MTPNLLQKVCLVLLVITFGVNHAGFADPVDNCFELTDLTILADQWLLTGAGLYSDIYSDSRIDFKDYALVAADWPADPACECRYWQVRHPEWIFCDDFEDNTPLVRPGRYFEYSAENGSFVLADGVGLNGSKGMLVQWQSGQVSAGSLKLGFGRNPQSYMNKGIRPNEDFRDIYYRMYLKMQPGWQGSPAKLSRATVFTSPTVWAQAMIAHLWSSADYLLVDPVSLVDSNSNVTSTKYNDFDHMQWLGNLRGITPIFDSQHDDTWFCIEMHVRLNDPGLANGIQEFWIDGQLEARKTGLNFVKSYQDYAINAIFLENYWNSGSPVAQQRYMDSFVVSTERIGCLCE